MITVKDISRACGVSTSTVSKALNGYSEIGPETTALVQETAKRLGYRPNSAARQLKTNRSHNIGVLFADDTQSGLTHEYFAAVLNSFKNTVERLGYDITFISNSIGLMGETYLEHCRYRQCDGVVIACVDFADPTVLELLRSDIPTVTIDFSTNENGSVLSDNVQGMTELVRYIHQMGHRQIALIHGEDTAVTRLRLAAFYRACAELGLEVPEPYIRQSLYHDPDNAAEATRELLKLPKRPTCILYPDDYSCLGGFRVLEREGLSVPNDISVTGYDGVALSQVLRPRLTTVKQDTDALGSRAAQMLTEAIEHPKTYIPQSITVPTSLLIGQSVKKLA